MKLDGRIALVTGASRGIGRVIARAYVGEGARVVVTGRDAGSLNALVAELGTLPMPWWAICGPDAPDALVAATLARFGGLDLLVNNAGAIHPARDLVDFAPEDWRGVIEVNLVAPAMLARAAVPRCGRRDAVTSSTCLPSVGAKADVPS